MKRFNNLVYHKCRTVLFNDAYTLHFYVASFPSIRFLAILIFFKFSKTLKTQTPRVFSFKVGQKVIDIVK